MKLYARNYIHIFSGSYKRMLNLTMIQIQISTMNMADLTTRFKYFFENLNSSDCDQPPVYGTNLQQKNPFYNNILSILLSHTMIYIFEITITGNHSKRYGYTGNTL